jgi:hypothetical protein
MRLSEIRYPHLMVDHESCSLMIKQPQIRGNQAELIYRLSAMSAMYVLIHDSFILIPLLLYLPVLVFC